MSDEYQQDEGPWGFIISRLDSSFIIARYWGRLILRMIISHQLEMDLKRLERRKQFRLVVYTFPSGICSGKTYFEILKSFRCFIPRTHYAVICDAIWSWSEKGLHAGVFQTNGKMSNWKMQPLRFCSLQSESVCTKEHFMF